MPFVSVDVWVEEPSCDGDCEGRVTANRLEELIAEALVYLDAGMPEEAAAVLRDNRSEHPRRFAKISDVKRKYKAWQLGRLDGFDGPAYRVKEE